ncbi:hypothetical protein BJ508DRAFT_320922 [Ascobolus immersus RN42]|uniref:Alpha-1,6-mannosyltransferase subunit n=1 Tax=Ascobolus immersus RN42 TaxID=1160509 RepID=A0A3N4IZF2_ASCIM|nr:hypothetical protein BJ508DRAFT_320922 [Ascobolus immersus RN42]
MHFALPNKDHRSSPLRATSAVSQMSRTYLRNILRRPVGVLIGVVVLLFLYLGLSSSGGEVKYGNPPAVLVTVIDRANYSEDYLNRVIADRKDYAKRHGYSVFIKDVSDYKTDSPYTLWAALPTLRHAMTTYPTGKFFWYLEQNAIIMNPSLSIEEHIMDPARLSKLAMRNQAVVPSSGIIKTFRNVNTKTVGLVMSMDEAGIAPSSMVIRNGAFAKYLLDAWYDPLIRNYWNWQRDKLAASLEHLVQWHPTILANYILIPQRILNSYPTTANGEGTYQDGDMVVSFKGCEAKDSGRNCEAEFNKYWEQKKQSSS